MTFARLALAGLGLASLMAPQALAGCEFIPAQLCDGCTLDQYITVTPGGVCNFRYQIESFHTSTTISSSRTLIKPKHGLYARAAAYDFAYKADDRYTGTDYFEAELAYNVGGTRPGRVVIRNHVTIK